MTWRDGITGVALDIAASLEARVRVMAGPGTGKSTAMKRKLMRLLEEGTDPKKILAVTFTRTAATDLVKEIQSMNIAGCEEIKACTLHSYCYEVLLKREVFQYTERTPRPLIVISGFGVLQFEAAPLLEDLDNKVLFGNKRDRTKRIKAFEAHWARLQSDAPGWAQEDVDVQFERVLLEWLRFHQAILIGELIPETLTYLRSNPTCPEHSAFEHVLVDEYQDLNKAEQTLIDLLAARATQGIFGDEDQSIYSFRHAHPEGIIQFDQSHTGTQDHRLDLCHRCPKRVVQIANHLIRHNHDVDSEARLSPVPEKPEGDVAIVQWSSLREEAQGIAQYVSHLLQNRTDLAAKDILILSPRRIIGYAIRDALIEKQIATHSFYHEEILEEDQAQEAFTLLTLLANSKDRAALRFWLGFGHDAWRVKEYTKLREHCQRTGEEPWDALEKLISGELQIVRTTGIQSRFTLLKERLASISELSGAPLIDAVFPSSAEWAKGIREASLLGLSADNGEAKRLYSSLRTRLTQPEMPESGEFARVMSLHKSKGLSSKVVIIAGCIQGLIPHINIDDAQDERERRLREQRRLFYVALTRAREILLISSSTQLGTSVAHKMGLPLRGRGSIVNVRASSFLNELGPNAPTAITGQDFLTHMT